MKSHYSLSPKELSQKIMKNLAREIVKDPKKRMDFIEKIMFEAGIPDDDWPDWEDRVQDELDKFLETL